MARSDFMWIAFDEHLTAGNAVVERSFHLEGSPIGTAYLLMQVGDVEAALHQVEINGKDLPSLDIMPSADSGVYTTWMDRIPADFLQQGVNRIAIRRTGNDSFRVLNVVVHWREAG
jgi:hypothetical protein